MDKIKNIKTILLVASTLLLAGVAVVTAWRLYQLQTQPVAPTAPEKVPAGEEEDGDEDREPPTPQTTQCTPQTFTLAAATEDSADLATTSLTTINKTLTPGESVTVEAEISNVGKKAVDTAFQVSLYSDFKPYDGKTAPAYPKCNEKGNSDKSISSLAAGAKTKVSFTFTAPQEEGDHFLWVYADSTCLVTEGTTDNKHDGQGNFGGQGYKVAKASSGDSGTGGTSPTATAKPTATAAPTSTAAGKGATTAPALPEAGVSWPTVTAVAGGILLVIVAVLLAF